MAVTIDPTPARHEKPSPNGAAAAASHAPSARSRPLGMWTATALVVGNMIGSGVFLLPAALAAFGGISLVAWGFTAVGAILLALVFARSHGRSPDSRLMAHAALGAVFLHCLPAHRGDEVTAKVIDGPQSLVFPQAENQLHTAEALLLSPGDRYAGVPSGRTPAGREADRADVDLGLCQGPRDDRVAAPHLVAAPRWRRHPRQEVKDRWATRGSSVIRTGLATA